MLAGLLAELGPDRDLVDEDDPFTNDFAGWRLMAELRKLNHVGATAASKLVARKRDRADACRHADLSGNCVRNRCILLLSRSARRT